MREFGRWRRGMAVVVGTLVGAASCGVTPAQAAVATSSGTWQATLSLPTYPCPYLVCAGTLSGALAGRAAGVDSAGHPFVLIWPDPTSLNLPTNLSGSFTYSEFCPVALTESAQGNFTLTGGYVDDNGVVSRDGAMSGILGWTRYGATFVMSTANGVITGAGQTLASQQTIGEGAGALVPEDVASTCANVQAIQAQATGTFVNPD